MTTGNDPEGHYLATLRFITQSPCGLITSVKHLGERIAGQAMSMVPSKSFESLAKPCCSCSDPPVYSQHVTANLLSTQLLSKLEYIPQNTPVFWELLIVNQAIQSKSETAFELSMSRRQDETCSDSHWTLMIINKIC